MLPVIKKPGAVHYPLVAIVLCPLNKPVRKSGFKVKAVSPAVDFNYCFIDIADLTVANFDRFDRYQYCMN
jgi:hypothetical protein